MKYQELKNFDFPKIFNEITNKLNINWNVLGLLTEDMKVISLGSDSKLIGRIFELLNNKVLKEIAERYNLQLEINEIQTVYPDFSYYDPECDAYIAVDVKTTYKEPDSNKQLGFTLGAYGSYLRNNTKNIRHPYNRYACHFDICFIYDRLAETQEGNEYSLEEASSIQVPYDNVVVFVKERYKLAGEKPGSGNTENIGSFKLRNPEDYKNYDGPFAIFGNDIFEDYWKNYPRYREVSTTFTNIDEYISWLEFNEALTDDIKNKYKKYKAYKEEMKNK